MNVFTVESHANIKTHARSFPIHVNCRIATLSLLACLLAIFLSACAIGPDYRRPEMELPARWRVEYQTAADMANTAWWEQFQDPALNELIGIALRESKDLRIASARVEEFSGRLQSVRSDFFPRIGYSASATRNSQSLEDAVPVAKGVGRRYTELALAGNAAWEIDIWGRLRRATEAARADLLSAEEGRRAVILTLVSEVARSYIGLLTLDKILSTAKETLASREEFLKLYQRKFDGGQISRMELAQVRTAYEQIAEFIPEVERRIALQENALSVLLGRNPGRINRDKSLDSLAVPEVPQGIPSDLLTRRPDILGSEQNLIAANARIGVARARYFPAISLTGLFGYASTTLSNLLTEPAAFWQTGAGAAGPLFTGGRLRGETRQAEARHQQLLYDYLKNIQTAFREVEDSLVGIQKYREILAAQELHVATLKDYAHYAHRRYDAKYESYIEVLDAEGKLFNSQVDYAQTRNNLFAALINSYKTMGGGWVTEASKLAEPSGRNTVSASR